MVGAAASVFLFSGSPFALAEDMQLPEYTGDQFQSLYEYAVANTLPNLDPPNGRYEITGNDGVDARIWELALGRGYVLRPIASENLGRADGVTMQPQAAQAWRALKTEARAALLEPRCIERIEGMLDLILGHPATAIANNCPHPIPCLLGFKPHAATRPARINGIAYEVDENLLEFGWIRHD